MLAGLMVVGTAGVAAGMLAAGARPAAGTTTVPVTEHSFVYGRAGSSPLSILAYLPRHRGLVPGVLVVHGGGWSSGTPQAFRGPAEDLAQAGLAAFDVGYQLDTTRRAGYPDQVDQLASALDWIRLHARALGVDPDRLGALGSSAGGNLVALLALDPRAAPLTAVVTWSAPLDLPQMDGGIDRTCRAGGCPPGWLDHDLLDYLGCSPRTCPESWDDASPADRIEHRPTDWLLFNSSHEVIPLAGAEDMAGGLRRDGDRVRLVVVPGDRHAGAYQSVALAPSVAFLKAELGDASPAPVHA